MALKVVILIRRRADLTAAQFRAYYETHHAPLALRLLGAHIADYRRSYVDPADPHSFARAPEAEGASFDVVTELWFTDRAQLEAMYALAHRPDIGGQIAADEARFMDRASLRNYVVDEVTL